MQRSHCCEFLSESTNPLPCPGRIYFLTSADVGLCDGMWSRATVLLVGQWEHQGQGSSSHFLRKKLTSHYVSAIFIICRRQVCGIGGQGAVPLSDLQHEHYDIEEIAWKVAMGQNLSMLVNTWKWLVPLVAMDVYHPQKYRTARGFDSSRLQFWLILGLLWHCACKYARCATWNVKDRHKRRMAGMP